MGYSDLLMYIRIVYTFELYFVLKTIKLDDNILDQVRNWAIIWNLSWIYYQFCAENLKSDLVLATFHFYCKVVVVVKSLNI